MKLFAPLYERALAWARHPKAPALLGGLSFAEAIVFPVMPEVMLAPMCLSQPKRGFWFATISLIFGLLGAMRSNACCTPSGSPMVSLLHVLPPSVDLKMPPSVPPN